MVAAQAVMGAATMQAGTGVPVGRDRQSRDVTRISRGSLVTWRRATIYSAILAEVLAQDVDLTGDN
jgi:hypothetical protein